MRLIDADAFITREKGIYCKDCDSWNGVKCRACWVDDITGDLDDYADAHTVNVGGVVRCKDCTEHQRCPLEQRLGWYGYCSEGERKVDT